MLYDTIKRGLIILTIIFFAGNAVAQSEQLSPSGRETSKPQKQETKSNIKCPTTTHTCDTKKSPLEAEVDNIQKPKIAASQPIDKNDKKSSSDWWVALFTGGIFVVGIIQLLLFKVQLKIMSVSLIDAEKASKIAKTAADAATVSAAATQKTVETFIKSERPHIVNSMQMTLLNGVVPHIDYAFTNIGKTIARIDYYKIELFYGTALPNPRSFLYTKPWKGSAYLGNGEKLLGRNTFNRPLTAEEIVDFKEGRKFLFIFGYIIYDDTFSHTRERGFGFRYLHNEHRCTTIGGRTYNYDDCKEND